MQLDPLATHLWHATHAFKASGLPITTRMTVVRLPESKLLIHSPIPMPHGSDVLRRVQALGTVAFIVAPNKMHHLFLGPCAAAFPDAVVYGPQGLAKKRPDLAARLHELPTGDLPEWLPDLEHLTFQGIPAGNESVWFHRPSATLIVTDLLQWMAGDLPWPTRAYAMLTGVRRRTGRAVDGAGAGARPRRGGTQRRAAAALAVHPGGDGPQPGHRRRCARAGGASPGGVVSRAVS